MGPIPFQLLLFKLFPILSAKNVFTFFFYFLSLFSRQKKYLLLKCSREIQQNFSVCLYKHLILNFFKVIIYHGPISHNRSGLRNVGGVILRNYGIVNFKY